MYLIAWFFIISLSNKYHSRNCISAKWNGCFWLKLWLQVTASIKPNTGCMAANPVRLENIRTNVATYS